MLDAISSLGRSIVASLPTTASGQGLLVLQVAGAFAITRVVWNNISWDGIRSYFASRALSSHGAEKNPLWGDAVRRKRLSIAEQEEAILREVAEQKDLSNDEGVAARARAFPEVTESLADAGRSYEDIARQLLVSEEVELKARLLNIAGNLLHAPNDIPVSGVVGSQTRVAINAIAAYMNMFSRSKLFGSSPNVILDHGVPDSYHSACLFLGIKPIRICSGSSRISEITSAMNSSTVAIITSISEQTPDLAAIDEISKLTVSRGVGLHLDVGPLYRHTGDERVCFDNPGINTATVRVDSDYGDKEASHVLVFRNRDLHRAIYFESGTLTLLGISQDNIISLARSYFGLQLDGLSGVVDLGRESVENLRQIKESLDEFIATTTLSGEQLKISFDLKCQKVTISGDCAHTLISLMKDTEFADDTMLGDKTIRFVWDKGADSYHWSFAPSCLQSDRFRAEFVASFKKACAKITNRLESERHHLMLDDCGDIIDREGLRCVREDLRASRAYLLGMTQAQLRFALQYARTVERGEGYDVEASVGEVQNRTDPRLKSKYV